MHEFTLIQSICDVVEKIVAENNLRTVTRIHLQVGKMRQIIPEFMRFAFATVAKGKIYETAELVIETIPIKILCHNCGREFEVEEDNIYLCPFCNQNDPVETPNLGVCILPNLGVSNLRDSKSGGVETSNLGVSMSGETLVPNLEILSGKEFILASVEGEQ